MPRTSSAENIAINSLNMEDPVLVRKGVQVLTVVGSDEDMSSVRELLNHRNKPVVKDARAALFERRIR